MLFYKEFISCLVEFEEDSSVEHSWQNTISLSEKTKRTFIMQQDNNTQRRIHQQTERLK